MLPDTGQPITRMKVTFRRLAGQKSRIELRVAFSCPTADIGLVRIGVERVNILQGRPVLLRV